jgi:V8-like Glu-specific endopeptidase
MTLLVSNKHVFINPAGKLRISLNQKNDEGSPDYGNIKNFEDVDFHGAYYEHPDPEVDLACVNVSTISSENVFYKTLNSEFLKEIDYDFVAQGTEIIFVGYPANRYDMVNNLPLVRKGIIASVPEIDFNGRGQIVIDAQVYQGSSGSPVFVAVNGRYVLLGIVSETMIRHAQLQTLPSALPSLGVQEILGLGIVVKQRHVKELFAYAVSEFLRRNRTN